jgi:hypothetical protein
VDTTQTEQEMNDGHHQDGKTLTGLHAATDLETSEDRIVVSEALDLHMAIEIETTIRHVNGTLQPSEAAHPAEIDQRTSAPTDVPHHQATHLLRMPPVTRALITSPKPSNL